MDASSSTSLELQRLDHEEATKREALKGVINHWLFELEQAKWPRALQYFENVSYLLSNHLTRFYYTADVGLNAHHFGVQGGHSNLDVLVAKQADNKLIRPVETVVSMFTEAEPVPRIEPASDRPDDEDAAAIAEIVTELFWNKPLQMQARMEEAGFVMSIAGTCAIEVEYGESGMMMPQPKFKTVELPNILKGEEGEPDTIEQQVQDGETWEALNDLMAHVWTPFHLTPDPLATTPDDMTWIARTTYEDREDLADAYGRDEEGYFFRSPDDLRTQMQPMSSSKSVLYWWTKIQDIIEAPQYAHHGGGLAPHSDVTPNQIPLSVIDVKPSRQFPRGRTLIVAGGQLVYAGDARAWDANYPWRWHPYAFMHWLKVPGRFWGIPLLTMLVPLQKKINAIDALVHANRQFMTIGQWLIPKQSKIPEGRPSGIPGEHLRYTAAPGMPAPEKVRHEPLPAELIMEREQLIASIDHIAASGMIGGQVSPSAARAGVMLDSLQSDKMRSKSAMLHRFERGIEIIAQNILVETQRHSLLDDPMLMERIRLAARDHSDMAVMNFQQLNLRDHNSIKIDIVSEMLRSPEADEMKALQYVQYMGGNITPAEREAVLRATGLTKYVRNLENAGVRRARRMISRLVSGQIDPQSIVGLVIPNVDPARVMAPIFQTEILSDRFYTYEVEVQTALFGLLDAYSQLAAEEAERERAMMIQMARAGAEGSPGGEGEEEAA